MSSGKRSGRSEQIARLGRFFTGKYATAGSAIRNLRLRRIASAFDRAAAAKNMRGTLAALQSLETADAAIPAATFGKALTSALDEQWALPDAALLRQMLEPESAGIRALTLWTFFGTAHDRHREVYDRLLSEISNYQPGATVRNREAFETPEALGIVLELLLYTVVDNRARCLDKLPADDRLVVMLETLTRSSNVSNARLSREYTKLSLVILDIIRRLGHSEFFAAQIDPLFQHFVAQKNFYALNRATKYLTDPGYTADESLCIALNTVERECNFYFDRVYSLAVNKDLECNAELNSKETKRNIRSVGQILYKLGFIEKGITLLQILDPGATSAKRNRSVNNSHTKAFRALETSDNGSPDAKSDDPVYDADAEPGREDIYRSGRRSDIWADRRVHLTRQRQGASERFGANADYQALRDFLRTSDALSPLDFVAETNRLLETEPQPARPCGAIALFLRDSRGLSAMPVLSFLKLKREGYALIPLSADILTSQPTHIPDLDALEGVFVRPRGGERKNAWEIDLQNGRAICQGINFFQGLEESVCCRFRRYTIDYSNPAVVKYAQRVIGDMDSAIVCIDKIKMAASKTGLRIKVFVQTVHISDDFVARHYINAISQDGDVELFQSCTAYENYFGNFDSPTASTLAVQNMTRHADLSQAYVPPPEEFERWYATSWPALRNESGAAESAVGITRVRRTSESPDAQIIKERVDAHRRAGGAAVCLFGKVLFDQGVPIKGGAAHPGMKEWFDHTIEIVRENPDLLLLVKPHPHELRNEIALYPTEMLADWMPAPLPENVIFLPHDMFNLHEVAAFTDLGLVWNGSASMELGVLDVACVVGSRYGHLDFPVGHFLPKDRHEYEQLIRTAATLRPGPGVKDRSRALIHYLRSDNISIPYRYTKRTLTNRAVRKLQWIAEDLDNYMTRGDPYVDRIADKIAR